MVTKDYRLTILLAAVFVAISGFALSVRAASTVEFPQDELAAESVYPVFDQPTTVKNRSVNYMGRFEVGLQLGYNLMEPFYNPLSFGGTATYHLDEVHAINLYGTVFVPGLSDNGENLNRIPIGSGTVAAANLQFAPSPKLVGLASYQYNAYYGKISLGKDVIMNLGLYGLGGLGMIGVGDSNLFAANVGVGQRFHFTPNVAFRFDLRVVVFQGPDVLSRKLASETREVSASEFDHKLSFMNLLSFGGVYLF
jgi:outer membrane beta-barrel protein